VLRDKTLHDHGKTFMNLRVRGFGLARNVCGGLHKFDDRIRKLRSSRLTANVASGSVFGAIDLFESVMNLISGLMFAQMSEHQLSRADYSSRVCHVLARNVGCRAVDGFEDGAMVAQVGAGNEAQPSNERGTKVGNNVAVEIFHH